MLLRRYHRQPETDEAQHPPPSGDGTGPDGTERPARSALKAEWVAYADRQDPGDHEAMTKDALIEQYGGDPSWAGSTPPPSS
ncbi:hypothetical protein GT204_07875 [Streptomyces sp. SID4919]|uniref:hypothetical protein n=1 Tax=unclassified Streptomyces TaxID=2593676 RepID=UPI000823B00F|nr:MULTISPECIES: hypothetical protein [unclassified Streptomyces]MYY08823.1 hypothetical protein [Streptomyces sp. SID4919]SCK25564.1 hypothetical protein YW7DRAFT_01959 [Streptomyces sp. AmelKG-E11A]